MKDNSKQAKFFCESCGEEVNAAAKFCNKCGKFFSSVRCPNCGKTGSTREFENGCPDCGYAVGKNKSSGYIGNSNSSGNNKNIFGGISSLFSNKNQTKRKSNSSSSDSLPLWVYFVVIALLIGIIICLYSCL